ncbi:unnamed protein product (macronuclear) [Paramecium tetraurelia]|uniref:Protein kinase domain-containing protein n=1 Tax=Paramecium tetraurelia TaxID=5888 RepID=A0DZ44_PARTE|nr:uncharacterized protein GSPATT00003280001 [Paramecium tetraurelia]CAK88311.1 unnamed protein product [Paramecium tetraurelia]|eukprot:XP_001455708.1 hypothetical protein (macronuclear) [Paramecium tetraurelia strain d4-2]
MGICQKKLIQSSNIKQIGPTDLETQITMIKTHHFDKNTQSYLVKDGCDQKEKIMTVVQKINDDQLKFIMNITIQNIHKIEKVYQTDSYSIIFQSKPQGLSIFEYCLKKESFDELSAKQLFKQLIQTLKMLNDLKITYYLQSPNQILVTPEGNVLLNGIYIKQKKESFTISIFNPPETEQSDIEKLNVWKCGILLYILLKGSLPNKYKYLYPYTVKDLQKQILFDPEDPTIPFLQRKLLIEMLNEQPEQRLNYNQILHNQWIIGNSTNVTPRQVISREIVQFDKYLLQCIQLDQYLKEFIETHTYLNIRHDMLLQSFSKFDLNRSKKIQRKDINYIKQVLKNEALILSILYFSESKTTFVYEECLQQWEQQIRQQKLENLKSCFPNQEVKKSQVVNYLQPKRKKYEDGLILSDNSQMITNLTKDIYQFDEFILEVQKGINEKAKDYVKNQRVFIKSEEIQQEFNQLLNMLKADKEYQSNKIQQNGIKQIQQILGKNTMLNLVLQKEIIDHLEQFEKQDQKKSYKQLLNQMINKLQ